VVGHGADVTVRASGGDDHAVGHRTLVLQVNENNVLGFLIVQAGQNQTFEGAGALVVLGGVGDNGLLRARRGFTVQRDAPS
jgi:hypothetical protein